LQFTIRRLMLAVAVLAGFMAVPFDWKVIGLVVIIPTVALLGANWLFLRSRRRLAAIWFGVVATVTNLLYVVACTMPSSYLLPPLFLVWFLTFAPAIAGLGIAWAYLATRNNEPPTRSPTLAWLLVIFVTGAPLVTLCTLWPLHLFFLGARPALETLADKAASGQPLIGPRWIGAFRLTGSTVDTATGEVVLFVDSNPNGPTGFVRGAGGPAAGGPSTLIRGSNASVHLGGQWWYREDE
jgi:hypothetical protein